MKVKENVQNMIKILENDPIVKILLKNCHITKIQLETLLIDFLSENFAEKHLKCGEKARFRLTKPSITRGAFNRTLKQAKTNTIRSIYTIILLGYIGIFQSTNLDPYIEVANKLNTYVDTYREFLSKGKRSEEYVQFMSLLRQELESTLQSLSNP